MKYKATAVILLALVSTACSAGGSHDDDDHHGAEKVVDDHGAEEAMDHHGAEEAMDHHIAKESDDHHTEGQGHSASEVGMAGELSNVTKTISVNLLDQMKLEFDPAVELVEGETVKFEVTNKGQIRHEFSIGSEGEQEKHRMMMRSMPNMVHEDENSVTLEPGETKSLLWNFSKGGPVVFACNIPGHSEAGMIERSSVR